MLHLKLRLLVDPKLPTMFVQNSLHLVRRRCAHRATAPLENNRGSQGGQVVVCTRLW